MLLDLSLLQPNLPHMEDPRLLERPSVLDLLYQILSVTRSLLVPHTTITLVDTVFRRRRNYLPYRNIYHH